MINKNFIIIVIGQIISLFGNAIQRFSMSLYLLEFTGSTAAFANILAISTIPYIIFAPIAGRIVDNVNRKKIMVYLDLFCTILIGAYAFILLNGSDNELIVAVVMFILSICSTLYGPAVTSSIPQIVNEDKLTTANGIINQVGSVVNFVGPILAGVLYGLLGIKLIVIINAISFLVSAIMELFLDIPDVRKKEEICCNNKENLLSVDFLRKSFVDMKNSFGYLKKEKKVVLGIIVSYALCNIFLVPILSIVAPYFINILLGLPSQIYGIVEGICVIGMILGGILISIKPNMFSMKKIHYTYFPMILGVMLMSILGFININSYALAGIFAISGMAIMLSLALSNILTLTFIQKEVPADMLGRVSAFSTAVATISVAPGQLLFGQVIDSGIPIGLILGITTIINIGLILFVKWNVRELDIIEK
ncbi:MFS transporter [Clostridium septicum]|uniref:MFS transporter n=3 Tax=Clostridium septicum TaxID=1504 RepID=A0A9N7PKT7_CLOSE|nr:MFS transporter [Clostridium septicum]AYE34452.1 MFS transporter [Clostridium septicum]QAS59855.1 MFS transporter [Clostridium septicum]UEC20906.1 MFS transporter [Clostridium septicum]